MSIVERAKELAHRAHAGRVDKAGRPYIEHVARVAAAVADDLEAEAVAWLHDVMEDGDVVFADKIEREFPVEVYAQVLFLTRFSWMPAADYYEAIFENRIALRVKLADIADNADEARLALLDSATADRLRRKYAKAIKMLGGEAGR